MSILHLFTLLISIALGVMIFLYKKQNKTVASVMQRIYGTRQEAVKQGKKNQTVIDMLTALEATLEETDKLNYLLYKKWFSRQNRRYKNKYRYLSMDQRFQRFREDYNLANHQRAH